MMHGLDSMLDRCYIRWPFLFWQHRLIWLFLERKTNFFSGNFDRVLHVAPEVFFEKKFRSVFKNRYLTADLNDPRAMVKMDVTNIKYPDNTFDVILCNHVLEHVQDDTGAMRELFRVLKTEGWAILNVPIRGIKTFEDPSVSTEEERLRVYGHTEHVRNYGLDYLDRLQTAGFRVVGCNKNSFLKPYELEKFGLSSYEGLVVYCRKVHQ